MATKTIAQQYMAELKSLEKQAATQHKDIRREANEARAKLSKARPRTIAISQIPGTTVTAPSTTKALQEARDEINKWEKEQLQKLLGTHLAAQKELQASRKHADVEHDEAARKAKLEAERFVPENTVKLATGELIDKTAFNKLPTKEQDLLRGIGVDAYNKLQETKAKHEMDKYIYLPVTKEYIDKAEFQELSPEYQTQLKARGVEGFNKYMEAVAHGKWAEAMRGEQVKLEEFQKKNIEVSPGNWIPKVEWGKLTPTQQTEVKKTGSYVPTISALSAKEQFEQDLKDGTIPTGSTFVGIKDGNIEYNLPSLSAEKQFAQALEQGDIPAGSIYVGSTTAGGFEYQQPVLPAIEQFNQAIKDGTIPNDAVYIGEKDKGFEYTTPVSAKEQFAQCLKTGEIPSDSVYDGKGDEGGFKYTSPSTQMIEYDSYSYGTFIGKKTMLKSEWDKLSDIGRTEKVLGRQVDGPEWMAYKLDEAGIEIPWWHMGSFSDLLGWISTYTPGTQQSEVIFKVRNSALLEWEKEYPDRKVSEAAQMAVEEIIPDLRAMRPHVMFSDLTWREHLMSVVNLALLTSPKWMPKVVRVVKKKFPRLRIGTKPFSEPGKARVEMQRVKLPTRQPKFKTTRVIGPRETIVPESRWADFLRARVSDPKLTPEKFMSVKTKTFDINLWKVKAEPWKVKPELPKFKPPGEIPFWKTMENIRGWKSPQGSVSKYISKADWEKIWKPGAPSLLPETGHIVLTQGPLPTGVPWRAPIIVPPYKMPQVFLPDMPVSIISPAITTKGGVITVTSEAATVLGLTVKQMTGTELLTTPQVRTISRAANITETRVRELAKQKLLAAVLTKSAVKSSVIAQTRLRALTQSITKTQLAALTEAVTQAQTSQAKTLTKLQMQELTKRLKLTEAQAMSLLKSIVLVMTKDLTKLQTQVLVKTLGLTGTQTKTLVKSLTQFQPAVMTQVLVKPAIVTEAAIKIKPITKTIIETKPITKTIVGKKAKPVEGKIKFRVGKIILPRMKEDDKLEKEKVYPAGTIAWKQGIYWKIIPPPYNLEKPITSRIPPTGVTKLEGTPQETLTFLEGKVPFANVEFDLGVVDGYIDIKKKTIHFTGEGEKTDIGKRLPSKTKGLTLKEAMNGETPDDKKKLLEQHAENFRVTGHIEEIPKRIATGLKARR